MSLYRLNDVVIRINGNAAKFLNGLTSNTLDAKQSAFLTIHGRIITTFFQKIISDEEVHIAVPSGVVEPLLNHLGRYAKLAQSKLEVTAMKVYFDLQAQDVIFTADEMKAAVSDVEFTQYRLTHNIPLQGIDYMPDEFILNVDSGQFVSFTKGCFLGQEPVAKVHNRSKPSKKLVATPEGFVFVKNT